MHSRTNWPAVALVVASGIVAALQVGKVAIALPALRTELALDLGAAGWVMGVFALLGVVGGIPAGAAVNRFGDRRLLVLGLFALAIGSAWGASAEGLRMLLASRVLEGAGFLLVLVAAPAVLQRVCAPQHRDLCFAIWSTFMPAGIALALLVGPAWTGWRGLWLANAVLAAAMALSVLAGVRRAPPATQSQPWAGLARDARATAASRGPLLLALAFAAYALQYFALISFLPVLLVERMAVSVAAAGALSALVSAVNILGNLAAGVLLSRGLPRWVPIAVAGAVMGLAGVGIFLPATPDGVVFLLCLVFSGVGGMLPATVLGSTMQMAPQPRLGPIALGLAIQGNNLGQLLGPVAVGAAVAAAGWPAAAVLVGAGGLAAVAMAFALRPVASAERREPA